LYGSIGCRAVFNGERLELEIFNILPQLKIHLNNLEFYGYHGLYADEQRAGNRFRVNIAVDCVVGSVIEIDQTVNYAEVFALVKAEMEIATLLMETLAQRITTAILARFSLATHVKIYIEKLAPPIPYFSGTGVGVEWEQKREL
jgi:7,8-dihydroneopterin aldolase/epimerase/oxygenase